ncbi:flagellar basal body P-ring protein FlgI [Bremerella alba]|uniref:Flagellar P-ring protein n=1 Tax=Bremerella alba TaxID=980252 RepID=A0A7V8V8U5_9BACT|nr:flagellar basal body P-ring protein FlgI [Bremerella alba]MBA2117089.1 Flagellar P-ring protein [Bremerella alba]
MIPKLASLTIFALLVLAGASVEAQVSRTQYSSIDSQRFQINRPLSDFVRVKGQEGNYLQGVGLVVGLKGTGDSDLTPTHRALSLMLKHMGNNSGSGPGGEFLPEELKNIKNMALVLVRADVPAEGAEEGDFIDCEVSSLGAKSLAGGTLAISTLQGPNPHDKTVWALASGPVELATKAIPTRGYVMKGCRIEQAIRNPFVTQDGKIYLVINEGHKDWRMAQEIVFGVNNLEQNISRGTSGQIAKALDQKTIVISIPPQYKEEPVFFLSILMETPIVDSLLNNKVVINKHQKLIVIGSDVEIGPVVINHNGIKVETANPEASKFVTIDTQKQYATRLKDLEDALTTLKVPATDIIDIVEALHHQGKVYGELIYVN